MEPERNRLEVLTVDALVEGVHFDRRFTPADAIGHRALAVNLSDLAAMGATPRLALLSLALPGSLLVDDLDRMMSGLAALAGRHRLHIAGGNLTRTPGPLMIDITVTGSVKRRQVLVRGGARPGDEVYVSGSIGAATAGLLALRSLIEQPITSAAREAVERCSMRYLFPEPRVHLGQLLGHNRAATSCMDLSDGLADGAHQLAEASGVGMAIDADLVPVDAGARAWFASGGGDPVASAIAGGDDYELLFTMRPRLRGRLKSALRRSDVPITRIGVCTIEPAVVLRRSVHGVMEDTPIPGGYSHFA